MQQAHILDCDHRLVVPLHAAFLRGMQDLGYLEPAFPDSYRPRGAADPAPTSRSQLDCNTASRLDCSNRKSAPKMPILCTPTQKEHASCFMTQYD
jgi:hypothetical protein